MMLLMNEFNRIQIYVYNTLVNEFPDDKMNLILNEKEMSHYQDYGQGLKKCYNNSSSTVAFCMLEMNINDADCMDDNFNHETFIDCRLEKYCCISKTMNSCLEILYIIDEHAFDKVYERIQ